MNKHNILRTNDGYAFNGLNVSGLAPRESQVLLLRAAGMSINACSEALNCGTQAIKSRMNSLFYKLQADNTPELITNAFKNGYLRFMVLLLAMHMSAVSPFIESQRDLVVRNQRNRTRCSQRIARSGRANRLYSDPLNAQENVG